MNMNDAMIYADITLQMYKSGDKQGAYIRFTQDPNANPLSFERFCICMDGMIRTAAEYDKMHKAHTEAWNNAG